jgi:hypothetical protein
MDQSAAQQDSLLISALEICVLLTLSNQFIINSLIFSSFFFSFFEGTEGKFIQGLGNAVGRGRESTQLILSHLQGTDTSYRFK